jgi:hypothetical protein
MPDDLRPSGLIGDIAATVADGIALTEHPVAPALNPLLTARWLRHAA